MSAASGRRGPLRGSGVSVRTREVTLCFLPHFLCGVEAFQMIFNSLTEKLDGVYLRRTHFISKTVSFVFITECTPVLES